MRGKRDILLLEDDRVDAMTIERALKSIHIANRLVRCENGEEGLQHLGENGDNLPCVILLDLNMPRMNGIEFLSIIKNDNQLKQLPVVVLTTSKADQDKIESFNLGVAGYMIKPVDYQKFVEVIKTIDLYWTLSEHPQEE